MVEQAGTPGMGATRFKLIMRYRTHLKELERVEGDILKLAKNLAVTQDCLSEALDREDFYKKETVVMLRKTEKAKL